MRRQLHLGATLGDMSSGVIMSGVRFGWPDGDELLTGVDLAWSEGRVGLIGANGSGKSSLLRVITGELAPTAGTVQVSGRAATLPQTVATSDRHTVAELLGIGPARAAIARTLAGRPEPADLELTADDWQVEDRALAALARLGFPDPGPELLDRPLTTLSGGEATLVGVAHTLLERAEITLLDEPTNNLDRPGRERLHRLVADPGGWPGLLIIVSHDRELLELVDQTAELHGGRLRTFGGPLSAYRAALEVEQQAAERAVRDARVALRKEQRQLVEARIVLARRQRYARTDYENKRRPKVIMKLRAREAQVSAGKYRQLHESRIAEARDHLEQAEDRVRDDEPIRLDLPGTAVPERKVVVRLDVPVTDGTRTLIARGPERVVITGRNGIGKTTLLRRLRAAATSVRVGELPQRMDLLDDGRSLHANLAAATTADDHEIRARLARFGFRGATVDRPAGTLSGGERFRATLAVLLLADPPPQLLIMDEPTNNLDLPGVEQLIAALGGFRGALMLVSHDADFCDRVRITRRWHLSGTPDRLEVEDRPLR